MHILGSSWERHLPGSEIPHMFFLLSRGNVEHGPIAQRRVDATLARLTPRVFGPETVSAAGRETGRDSSLKDAAPIWTSPRLSLRLGASPRTVDGPRRRTWRPTERSSVKPVLH